MRTTHRTLPTSRIARITLAHAAMLPALAHAHEPPAPDKSAYTLVNPTPRELLRDMSTDRPDTTESPYTVDAGRFQVELSFADFTYDRHSDDAQTVRSIAIAPVLLKAGLLHNVDIQLGIDPYTHERSTDRATDSTDTTEGFGDTVVRLKVNLWGNDGGDTAMAIMPFITFPTASDDSGNSDIEGGLIFPFAVSLPNDFSLGLMAELDFNRSANEDRHVIEFVHTITLGHPLMGELSGYIEYAGFASLSGEDDYRGYLDTGLTYALSPDMVLDAGVRIGLTQAADDAGIFAGMSFRF